MERLNESQLRAHALKMFEENYSYSVIAKKLSHSKGWVSKWTRHWKTNLAESLQSQSRRRLTNKAALHLTAKKNYSLGFPTRFLPKPKNRVTQAFFKIEKPVFRCM